MDKSTEFRMLLLLLSKEKYEMALICFADESGTHDATGQQLGSQVAGVAGYVFPKEIAQSLEDQWLEILRRFGVSHFHMKELSAGKGEYSEWDQERKDSFVAALASVMKSAALPVGALVYVDDYDRILSKKVKAFYKHPYHLAFQLFLSMVCHELDELHGTKVFPGEDIAFYFDQQQQFSGYATETFGQMQRYQDPNSRLGAITFVSSRKYILLQAADLFASRLRKVEAREKVGESSITEGGWDDMLLPRDTTYVVYYGAAELENIQQLCDAGKWYKPDGSKLTSF